MEESETGRKWIKGGGWHNRLKKRNKKVKVGKSKKGASAEGQHSHIKKWKWKRGQNQNGRKWKGGKKLWNYQTEISQWKSESKSVKSKSENSVSKWKVPLETLDLGAEQELPLDEKWKSVRRNTSEATGDFELYQPIQIVPSEYCLLESQRI